MALRVLHIGKFYPPHRGGMEVFLADLIREQRACGIEAAAIVHGTPEPEDPPWLTRVPVQFQVVFAPIALGFRAALVKAIQTYRPDVLHLHMPNNSALWILTVDEAKALPWVVHWHSDVVASRIKLGIALAYKVYRPFEQALLERTTRIIATSPAYLAASQPLTTWNEKCVAIPLALDISKFPQSPYAFRPIWTPNKLRVLSVGRLTYYKGFETLIKAIANLTDTELIIVGDGELHNDLQALVHAVTPSGKSPNVKLLGAVDDDTKHALLESCDVFCLASRERTEAFGLALLEAMYHARPCIVSSLPGSGMPWLVNVAGSGTQAPPDDEQAWINAIAHMRNHPALRLALGEAGRRSLHSQFAMKTCVDSISDQYALAAPEASRSAKNSRDLLIVIPARNEALTIGKVLSSLSATGWNDVLVVNDQSTDETANIAQAHGAQVLSPVLPVGAWGGMQAGIRYALQHGYQAVITMDADGQHEVDEIPTLLKVREQADLVVGAFPERASRLRQIAWDWFRHLAGFDLRDLTSGFRLYSRQAIEVLASREATLLDYQDLGALLLVRRAGLQIAEVPVTMNTRTIGKSRIFNSWVNVAKYMLATSLLCLARWSHRSRGGL